MSGDRHFIHHLAVRLRPGGAADRTEAETLAGRTVTALLPAVEDALDRAQAEFGDLVLNDLDVAIPPIGAGGVTERDRTALRDAVLAAIRDAVSRTTADRPAAAGPPAAGEPAQPAQPAALSEDGPPDAAALRGWTPAWLFAQPERPQQMLAALRRGVVPLAAVTAGRSPDALHLLADALAAAEAGSSGAGRGPATEWTEPEHPPSLQADPEARLRGLATVPHLTLLPQARERDGSPAEVRTVASAIPTAAPTHAEPGSVPGAAVAEAEASNGAALLQRLRDGRMTVAAMTESQPPEALPRLFRALAAAAMGAGNAAVVAGAAAARAAEHPQPAAFWRRLLQALADGAPLDLEAAAAAAGGDAATLGEAEAVAFGQKGSRPAGPAGASAIPTAAPTHAEPPPDTAMADPEASEGAALLQRLREGRVTVAAMTESQPLEALPRLFRALAAAAIGAGNAALVAGAAVAVAAEHPQPAAYWRRLLQALADGAPLDLEAAAAAAGDDAATLGEAEAAAFGQKGSRPAGPAGASAISTAAPRHAEPPPGTAMADPEASEGAALLQRLRSGAVDMHRMTAAMPAPALAALFHRLARAAMGRQAAALLDAASGEAAGLADPAPFWRALLTALVAGQPLDLEAAHRAAAAATPARIPVGETPVGETPVRPPVPAAANAPAGETLAAGLRRRYDALAVLLQGGPAGGTLAAVLALLPAELRFRLHRLFVAAPGLAELLLAHRTQPERQAFSGSLGRWAANAGASAAQSPPAGGAATAPDDTAGRDDALPEGREPADAAAAALVRAVSEPPWPAALAADLARMVARLAPQAVWPALRALPLSQRLAAADRLAGLLAEAELAALVRAAPGVETAGGWLIRLEAVWTLTAEGTRPGPGRRLRFWQRVLRLLAGGDAAAASLAEAFATALRSEQGAATIAPDLVRERLRALQSLPALAPLAPVLRAVAPLAGGAAGPNGGEDQPPPDLAARHYALYDRLRAGAVADGGMAAALRTLQAEAPLLLHRLWGAAAAEPALLAALTWQRPPGDLRALLSAVLALAPAAPGVAGALTRARSLGERLSSAPDAGGDAQTLRAAIHALALTAAEGPGAGSAAGAGEAASAGPTSTDPTSTDPTSTDPTLTDPASAGAEPGAAPQPPSLSDDASSADLPEVVAIALAGAPLPAVPRLAPAVRAVLARAPDRLAELLRRQPAATAIAAVLALPEADRARLLARLAPAWAEEALAALEWLVAGLAVGSLDVRPVAWTALAERALAPARAETVEAYARSVIRRLATATGRPEGALARQLAVALAPAAGDPVAARLRRLAGPEAGPAPAPAAAEPDGGGWWTDDAGVVLLSVYLPRLFAMRELVAEGAFVDATAPARARALTRYAVWGDVPEAPGPETRRDCIAALLCGLDPNTPFEPVALEPDERALVDGLLQAVVTNWSAIGNTSVAGLREAFLQRPGVLRREAENWRLRVEGRAYDMLIDRLPWSYGTVRHRWMEHPLLVDWRP